MKKDWKALMESLRSEGFNVVYQEIHDEEGRLYDETGDLLDEVAIYDDKAETQLFYVTDSELAMLNDRPKFNDGRVVKITEIVKDWNKDIEVKI